jgi:uncharacterized membrane protein YedE/YeeE
VKAKMTAAIAGLVFGVGLVVSGMTDPRNVIGFLSFFSHWNPELALVMIGAIGVHAPLLRLLSRTKGTSPQSLLPGARVDAPLLAGAAVFGVGWGLGGYCPGPAIVSLGFGRLAPVAFVGAAVLGMLFADALRSRSSTVAGPTCAE